MIHGWSPLSPATREFLSNRASQKKKKLKSAFLKIHTQFQTRTAHQYIHCFNRGPPRFEWLSAGRCIQHHKTYHLDYSCSYLRVVTDLYLIDIDVTMELLQLLLLTFLVSVVVPVVVILLTKLRELFSANWELVHHYQIRRARVGGLLGLFFAGYVPLASQSPYPIIVTVHSVANYRPHLSHFWAKI